MESKGVFLVIVDYSKTLAEMIKAGKYDYINLDINAVNFPSTLTGKQEFKVELVRYRYAHRISSSEVLADFDRHGYRPATLPELLAFGEKYPDEQREVEIVALGSVWQNGFGSRDVACLYSLNFLRMLSLNLWFGGWTDSRFLAIRK